MNYIISFSGDIFAVLLIWRARKLVLQKQQKMYETESDAKLRKAAGYFLILVGAAAIYVDHFVLKF